MTPNNQHNDKYDNLNSIGCARSVKKKNRNEKGWNEMYDKLISYKEQHGDCLVPSCYKEDKQLARWVVTQRRSFRKNIVSIDRIEKLKSIGFVFNIQERWNEKERWNNMYERLILYKENHGNCLVPTHYEEDTKLARWISDQRTTFKINKLSNDRIDKLKLIGFVFDCDAMKWNDMFNRLVSYKQKYGNFKVPSKYEKDTKLGRWVCHQRTFFKNKTLSKDRIDKLKSIGFVFHEGGNNDNDVVSDVIFPSATSTNSYNVSKKNKLRKMTRNPITIMPPTPKYAPFHIKQWNKMYERLISYKQKYGNCKVPRNYKEDKQLAIWVMTQRAFYKQHRLPCDRIDKLKSIGFMFPQRDSCNRRNNSTNITKNVNNNNDGNNNDINNNAAADNKVTPSAISNSTNTSSISYIKKWNYMYNQLISYKEKYGNCLVPRKYEIDGDTKLRCWVNNQRDRYKKNKLSKDRIDKLKLIGFVFDCGAMKWDVMFNRLVSYKQKYGNCKVPRNYKEDKQLAIWVMTQRAFYKQHRLPCDRIDKLKSIGFVFRQRDSCVRRNISINITKNANNNNDGNNNDDNVATDNKVMPSAIRNSTNSSSSSYSETVAETTTVRQQKVVNYNEGDKEIMDENIFLHNDVIDEVKANDNNTMTFDLKSVLPATTIMVESKQTTTTTRNSNIFNDKKREKEDEEIMVNDECFHDELRSGSHISSIVTSNSKSSTSTVSNNSSLFADAEDDEEDFDTSTSSKGTTSNRNSWCLSEAASNTKNTICNDNNDSIFADAEEDEDVSFGLF